MFNSIFLILTVFLSHIYAQDIPDLDEATSFTLHASSGQSIGSTVNEVRQTLGTPADERQINYGDVGFGLLITLKYGSTELQFYEEFAFRYHYVEINDNWLFAKVNGIDLRVGDLADELAEHFPKSWAARNFNWPSRTSFPNHLILVVRISEVESISVFINSSGLISKIRYSMRLT